MLDFEWGFYLAECINSNYFDNDLNQQICYSKNHELVLGVSRAISKLDSETSGFAFFDLGLSESDLKVLNQLDIDDFKFYTNYGELSILDTQLTDYIKSLSSEDKNHLLASHLSQLITNISNNILEASGFPQALINVRSFVNGTEDGYFPNWHIDKSIAEVINPDNSSIKASCGIMFIFLLKGETTLFHPISIKQRDLFHLEANESAYTYGYDYNLTYIKGEGLDKMFDISKVSSANFGKGSVHLVGHQCGTIHAVPSSKERLFINIFPGSESDISAMKKVIHTNLY